MRIFWIAFWVVGLCGNAVGALSQEKLPVLVHFIDVGQGDAVLIDLFAKKYVLIDAGPHERSFLSLFHYKFKKGLAYFFSKKNLPAVDCFVLSHAHDDHVGGLKRVLKTLPVREVWDSGFVFPSKTYRDCLKLLEKLEVPYKIVRQGFSRVLEGVRFDVLSPKRMLRGTRNDANNNSLVVKMTYQDVSFLFAGDIEVETEWRLLKLGKQLQSTILKVPHHGANTSSTRRFLELVNPELAIISCGVLNHFGHPAPETLARYQQLNIDVYRTDQQNTITIHTDGQDYRVFQEDDGSLGLDNG